MVAMLYEHDICEMATVGLVLILGHKICSTGPTWWILVQNACIDKC